MNSPQMEFAGNIGGLQNFLSQCSSAALAMAIQPEITKIMQNQSLDSNAPLTVDLLNTLRQSLYSRNDDPDARQTDILMILADALRGKGVSSGNPIEDRLRFVEILQDQLQRNGRVNFQRALAESIAR